MSFPWAEKTLLASDGYIYILAAIKARPYWRVPVSIRCVSK
jgi:hypothetical protein